MRPIATWLLVGALLALGLLAGFDELRGESPAPARAGAGQATTEERLEAAAGPPEIEDESAVAAELAAARIGGTLYLTDADCRLWALDLPDLAWRPLEPPAGECRFAVSPNNRAWLLGKGVWEPTGDLSAVDHSTRMFGPRILVESDSTRWAFAFEGSSPAFRLDGALTFARRGVLWGWVEAPCRPGEEAIVFRGLQATKRCARPLLERGALDRAFRRGVAGLQDPVLDEAVWLDRRTVVVLVHGRAAGHGVAVLVDGEVRARHTAFAVQVSDLEASPRGTSVAYRAGGLSVFDRHLRDTGFLCDAHAIAWPPNERFTLAATGSSAYIIRPGEPMIQIPVAASDIAWVD